VSAITTKKREQIFAKMSPALQAATKHIGELLTMEAKGLVKMAYQLGIEANKIVENEKEYGSGGLKAVAEYHGIPGGIGTLETYRLFAKTFDPKFIDKWMSVPRPDGSFLTTTHWISMCRADCDTEEEYSKLLQTVIDKNWTTKDLIQHIRASGTKHTRSGGRLPKTPSSALGSLQKSYNMANALNRWQNQFEAKVAQQLEDMTEDNIDDRLLAQVVKTANTMKETREAAEEAYDRLRAIEKHFKDAMTKRKKGKTSDNDEEEPKAAKKKKAVTAAT
jgi:hypothetical protein